MTEIKEDFLEVDPSIPGQKYTCISFVSPDKIIKQHSTRSPRKQDSMQATLCDTFSL